MISPPLSVDIFCSVIDNFGDIGVCWRLAKQLQQEYDLTVRLWVDDLASFAKLDTTLSLHITQQICKKIDIRHWSKDNFCLDIEPYNIVIEGFGCRLPESYLQAMAQHTPPPVWLNLEYLSAESWTLDCHGLASSHPSLPLKQQFFFPSFDERGGGLLREANLIQQRDNFQQDATAQAEFWQSLACSQALDANYKISLFAYQNKAVESLLSVLSQQAQSCFIAIPEGKVLANVNTWAKTTLKIGDCLTIGSVTVAVLPFLSPSQYDQLLWACDINCVRGEDSFIRAHWAAKPFLWHIYPQDEDIHLTKLAAWQTVTSQFIKADWQALQQAWVKQVTTASVWQNILSSAKANRNGHQQLSDDLSKQDDLCRRLTLMSFA